ncbi:hypothetical protein FXN61_01460 [Lentzea sp. PSKA42]|uniref:AAA+ ATPase domain-containing protein n=1 Tax=Lentzea indica TaxID=2604800 RepID=A0ABX1FA05_9PSEU|nr:hypothetical protein [Lentzea indica]NKE55561.1 hypothetical protein [Lentzea indica]
MTRDDSEDAVFARAVTAALEPARARVPLQRDPVLLRHTVEVAKPWVMAQAQSERRNYVDRKVKVAAGEVGWAARRPELWRWVFVVVIPTITWPFVPWAGNRDLLALAGGAVFFLLMSLVMVAVSSAGATGRRIGRGWAIAGMGVAPWLVGTVFLTSIGGSIWWTLALVVVFTGIAGAVQTAVETVLPTPAITAATAAADQAFEEWCAAVLEQGVLPVLRTELRSNQAVPGVELRYRDAAGLQKGGSLISHQPVPAGRRLAELVRTLAGGSFALAGPRGAGKTSLLDAFCQGAYREPEESLDLAIVVAAPVDYVPREFVLHLYARTCRAVLWYVASVDPRAVKAARRRDRWWRPLPDEAVLLVRSAQQGLQDVAYVQTRSGEASGKFGFRGAELSFKRGVSLAGRAATFPELVDDFRGFVWDAARALAPTRVVIAIDEMDRIGAGESARRFLNEIKAIFDVPGCYYLMSVSTEAQHDFEMAGMGLRSVFDSSFDEVVRVDYLDFDLARSLISRSVEELPDAFVALAYAFSGGLARQLTRSARAIVRQKQGTLLAAVTEELIADELDRVCKTTGDALTALDDHDAVNSLLRVLADPVPELHDYRKAIQAAYEGEDAAIRNLRDLAAARIEFLAVVRDYFTDELTEALPAEVNALARARRYAGSNPATGLALLEEFSSVWSVRPAPEPRPR